MKNAKSFVTIIFILCILCTLPVLAQNELMDANFEEPNAQDIDGLDVNIV